MEDVHSIDTGAENGDDGRKTTVHVEARRPTATTDGQHVEEKRVQRQRHATCHEQLPVPSLHLHHFHRTRRVNDRLLSL